MMSQICLPDRYYVITHTLDDGKKIANKPKTSNSVLGWMNIAQELRHADSVTNYNFQFRNTFQG